MDSETLYDLVIYDGNVEELGEEYVKRSDAFDAALNQYSSILEKIVDEGIKEGKVHDNLYKLLKMVNVLKLESSNIAKLAKQSNTVFLKDIDTADSYLY